MPWPCPSLSRDFESSSLGLVPDYGLPDPPPPRQSLEKIFRGSASFHVSLEENYKEKSTKDLKGALAPDAMFIKLRSDTREGETSLEVPCSVYAAQTSGTRGGLSGARDPGVVIEFEKEAFLLRRGAIRYVVSSVPHSGPSKAKAGPGAGATKRVASVIFEGVTLNLVEAFAGESPDAFKALVSKLMEGGKSEGEGWGPALGRKRGRSEDLGLGEDACNAALELWLGTMDAAVGLVRSGRPGGRDLDALAVSVAEHREAAALAALETVPEGDDPNQDLDRYEQSLECLEGDKEKTAKFLRDFVAMQREREQARHGALIQRLM